MNAIFAILITLAALLLIGVVLIQKSKGGGLATNVSSYNQIADYLKNRCAVVVNLKRVTPEVAKRIVDFLGGTIYAIGGTMQKSRSLSTS